MVFAIEAISYPANYGTYYGSSRLGDRIQHLKQMDAEWITLTTRILTPNKTSSNIFTDKSSVPDADLKRAIEQAHDAGLKVMLKPHLRMDPWNPPHEPSDFNQFFKNYQEYMVRYAKIAEAAGAEMFSVGNELTGIVEPGNEARWSTLINAVNNVYDGAITYSSQYRDVKDAEMIYRHPNIDVIGVNAYYPVAANNDNNATYQEMKAAWTSTGHYNNSIKSLFGSKSAIQYFGDLAVKYDKPVMFTEFGYSSLDGTASRPGLSGQKTGKIDNQEQADAFKAFFDAWAPYALPSDDVDQAVTRNKFFLGAHIWETKPNGSSDPRGHTYEGKPAETVIKNAYKTDAPGNNGGGGTDGEEPTPPQPTPTPPQPTPTPTPPQAGVIAEFGEVSLNHSGKWVSLNHTYIDPVVIAVTPSFDGGEEISVRFTNIGSNGFRVVLDEPSNRDGSHATETVSYLVVEAGTWKLPDGTKLQAGTMTTDLTPKEGFAQVGFDKGFGSAPVVLTQLQTFNGGDFANARKQSVNANGFRVSIEEEEAANVRGYHVDEKIGWVAIEEGSGTWSGHRYFADIKLNAADSGNKSLGFGSAFTAAPEAFVQTRSYDGSDPVSTRYKGVNKDAVTVTLQEDQTFDNETGHGLEDMDVFALQGSGTLSADVWL